MISSVHSGIVRLLTSIHIQRKHNCI